MTSERITVRAYRMGGVLCFQGLRRPVATMVGMVGEGMSPEEILAADVREALRHAAEAVRERELPLAAAVTPAPTNPSRLKTATTRRMERMTNLPPSMGLRP